ncbi:CPBP family intramembrane glutamic endopeptidase [Streptococcus caprae]|uniref:CPBP family intramembrane glutamic endopeptidase n=1 Tax=Streptococcus caprae TaxID=1640501 RepID=A0ABV8CUG0_9STRE
MKLVLKMLKIIGLIVLALSVNIIPMLLIGNQSRIPVELQWGCGLAYIGIAAGVISLVWKRYRSHISEAAKSLKFGWKDFGIALLFFVATRVVAVGGTVLNQLIYGNTMTGNDAALMANLEDLKSMFPLFFICFHLAIGVFAPILEELVFRGFMSEYFFKGKHMIWQLVLTSLVFGMLHVSNFGNFVEIGLYFALGAIFYLAFNRRRNIVDSIAVHLLNNCLLVIISVISYLSLIF